MGTQSCLLAKNGGPEGLMDGTLVAGLTGLILLVLDGVFGVEASVTIMSMLVDRTHCGGQDDCS